jgi:hypothetical protein
MRNPRPPYRIIAKSRGVSIRGGVCAYVANLLEANETLPRRRKLTDKRLEALIKVEYPEARSVKRLLKGEITIGYWRALYNSGLLSKDLVTGKYQKPKVRSRQYDQKGRILNPWNGKPYDDQNQSG